MINLLVFLIFVFSFSLILTISCNIIDNVKNVIKYYFNKYRLKKNKNKYLIDEESVNSIINELKITEVKEREDTFKNIYDKLNNNVLVNKKVLNYNYNNVKIYKINKRRFIKGSYSVFFNSLRYDEDVSLTHEFTHLSSSLLINKRKNIKKIIYLCGLSIHNKSFYMGNALNEGCTNLYDKRMFHDSKNLYDFYKNQTIYAMLIETFFDDPSEMEKLYRNINLPGLIDYFKGLDMEEDIISIILKMDLTKELTSPLLLLLFEHSLCKELYNMHKKTNPSIEKSSKYKEIASNNKMIKKFIDFEDKKTLTKKL